MQMLLLQPGSAQSLPLPVASLAVFILKNHWKDWMFSFYSWHTMVIDEIVVSRHVYKDKRINQAFYQGAS